MSNLIFVLHLFSTVSMVGLIWFVQIVHYPLFNRVQAEHFAEFEQDHQSRTTFVVAPLMLVEVGTAILMFWLRPDCVDASAVWCGFVLLGVIWASTFFLQVPAHERLAKSFDSKKHISLVRTNWLRTAAWSARGLIVCSIVYQSIS